MARKEQESPKAEMTPMIDVVFQLMIFFIVTIKQDDIFSKLNALVPTPNPDQKEAKEEKDTSIKIQIGQSEEYVAFNGVPMRFDKLDENIKKLAAVSTDSQILLCCTLDSYHGVLIRVLDICHKYKLKNLSILSM